MKSGWIWVVSLSLCFTTASVAAPILRLATTTSVRATGLLDKIEKQFERDTGIALEYHAVGSGKALQLAREGRVDVLLAHAPSAEKQLVSQGVAARRIPFMRNFFLIVGPEPDPANIRGTKSATEAFRRIAQTGSLFISRGDDSGTHKKELELWKAAGIVPRGSWYFEAGLGMGKTLEVASRERGYLLVDDATWSASRSAGMLKVLLQDREHLVNTYSVILLSRRRFPRLNHDGADVFAKWLLSDRGRSIVRSMNQGGVRLFTLLDPP